MSTCHIATNHINYNYLHTCTSLHWIVENNVSCRECCNERVHTISNVTPYHIIYCVPTIDSNGEKNVVYVCIWHSL